MPTPRRSIRDVDARRRSSQDVVREVFTSLLVCLVIDLDEAFHLVKRHITSKYGIDESEISLLRVVLEVAPYHIVDWKYYKEGYDELGGRRIRAYRRTYLVFHDGTKIVDLDRLRENVRQEALREARMKHGVVRAVEVIAAKGIGKREARRRDPVHALVSALQSPVSLIITLLLIIPSRLSEASYHPLLFFMLFCEGVVGCVFMIVLLLCVLGLSRNFLGGVFLRLSSLAV